jgi:dTDP-4-dehydrorhamnose 3,5-epimerase
MEIIKRLLNDVLVLRADVQSDGFETAIAFEARELQVLGVTGKFIQDNQSRSATNVLRGLHYQIQHPQGKLVRVLTGHIFDVIVDLRCGSATFGKHSSLNIKASDIGLMLWIPPGFAHGFFVLEGPADVAYSVTDYRYAEFERTLLWSDPALKIEWPLEQQQPLLSEKDQLGILFSACEYYS